MPVDTDDLRTCLGHFATGITVVTTMIDGAPHGVTVNSFTAVSLEPALVLISLNRRSRAAQHLENQAFAVNVLHESQSGLARRFAGDRDAELPVWVPGHPVPRLAGTVATVVCSPWASYDGGDHRLFLGRTEEFSYHGGDPLVFYRGAYRRLTGAKARAC